MRSVTTGVVSAIVLVAVLTGNHAAPVWSSPTDNPLILAQNAQDQPIPSFGKKRFENPYRDSPEGHPIQHFGKKRLENAPPGPTVVPIPPLPTEDSNSICPSTADTINVHSFGVEFSDRVQDLPPDQQKQLDLAITKIAVSFDGPCTPVSDVFIEGFADIIRGHPELTEAQRREQEKKVSLDRAVAVRDFMKTQLEAQKQFIPKLRDTNLDKLFSNPVGNGISQADPAQSVRNRRVIIHLSAGTSPPPPPKPTPSASVKKIVVWLNAFIPRDVNDTDGSGFSFTVDKGRHKGNTAIPGPSRKVVPTFDDAYLTDQRNFDLNPAASSRIHAIVDIDFSGTAPAMRPAAVFGATADTVRIRQSTGEELNRGRGVARGKFNPIEGFTHGSKHVKVRYNFAGANPVAKMPGGAIPTASDPAVVVDPDIDMLGEFEVDTELRTLKFRGLVDGFPAFEAYINVDGTTHVIYQISPERGVTPADGLLGTANRRAERDLKF